MPGINVISNAVAAACASGMRSRASQFQTGAIFRAAEAQSASFLGANLRGAIFSRARLVEADFSNADLTGVNFTRADLSNAYLSAARGLRQAQLRNACGNRHTRLPRGLVIGHCS